jgi:cyclase
MPRRRVPRRWPGGLQELAPGVFAYIQPTGAMGVSNAGLIVGDGEALGVDSLMIPRMTRAFRRAIRRATRAPVRYLVNTHFHIDHVGGNQFFREATIIAHANCRREMLEFGLSIDLFSQLMPRYAQGFRQIELTPPTLTYEDRMVVHVGDKEVHLLYLGRAHTQGDTLVYLPKEKILFAGDVAFFYVTPGPFHCHVSGWIRVCDRIQNLEVEAIVPGHGPVGDKGLLREMRQYLALVRREARKMFREGVPEQEAARRLKVGGYYAQWAEPSRLDILVQRLYMELRGEL